MTVEPVRLRLDPAPAAAVGTAVDILSGWLPLEHDFAVARTLAPDDLLYAWSTLTDDMKRDALAAYRDLAEGESHAPCQALVNPRFDRIGRQLWQQILCMMESNLEYVPPLTRGDIDVGERGGHGR